VAIYKTSFEAEDMPEPEYEPEYGVLEARYAQVRALLEQAQSGDSAARLVALRALVPHTEWLLERSEAVVLTLEDDWTFMLRQNKYYTSESHYIDVDTVRNALGEPMDFAPVAHGASGQFFTVRSNVRY
jgi:hypothetical protein